MASKQVDFNSNNVKSSILAVTAPMLTAQLVNLMYNIVDRIYIGKIPGEGTLALASVGLCFPIITMVTAFANLFGAGGAPLCSIARGKGDHKEAVKILNNAYFMLLMTGILLMVFTLIFHKPILYLFGASDQTYPYAASYMMIYLSGTLFVLTSLGLNPYINCQGFASIGMRTVLLGAFSNLILDPIFIFVLHLGVNGAAIATVLSQLFSAIWVLKFLTGEQAEISLDFKGFFPDFSCIRNIAALGVSSFIMSFTNSLTQIACNSMLSIYGGDLYISVMTVINSIREISHCPINAVTEGASPIISYNYGARKHKTMKEAINFMTALSVGFTLAFWLLVVLFPKYLIMIFNRDPKLLEIGIPSLRLFYFGFVFMAFQFIGQTTFKALNHPKQAVFFSLFRKVVIVVPLTFLLPRIGGLGVNGVFLAEPISNVIGGLACYITVHMTILHPLAKELTQERKSSDEH